MESQAYHILHKMVASVRHSSKSLGAGDHATKVAMVVAGELRRRDFLILWDSERVVQRSFVYGERSLVAEVDTFSRVLESHGQSFRDGSYQSEQ